MCRQVSLHTTVPVFLLLLFTAEPLRHSSPWSALWTTPCILIASVVITWGAESAQFFVAQGFALAILAWMQTLPEFAVEAVLAWKQQVTLLLANLTGALRLLTGLAWPMIYLTAATVHRRRTGRPLNTIQLAPDHSVEVIGLVLPLAYAFVIWWKRSIHAYDAVVLVVLYLAYLALLTKLPPQEREAVEQLESIPRRIVLAPRVNRMLAIAACFTVGGALVYFTAEPFLGSLVAVAGAIGIPSFAVIQWLAPVISEFPEFASTFYFARQSENASVALMNIASSNINQWTLLFAMLPIVFSVSRGAMSGIPFDPEQESELLLTIAQSSMGLIFLANMKFCWWEALGMFVLFVTQLALPTYLRGWITYLFFAWALIGVAALIARRRLPPAVACFLQTWRRHVQESTPSENA
jgi:cation:H+ antiporter